MAGSPSVRMFLVRHGEVAANRDFAFVGRGEDRLTAAGVEQAAGLASFFRGLSVDLVVSSPLERCQATARAVATATGSDVEADFRIIEQSFGEWDGLTRAEIDARGETAREQMRTWQLDPSSRPPGGESLLEVQERALSLAQELAYRGLDSVVWVSHVGPIKAMVCHALALPLSQVGRFFLDPASISVVEWRSPPILRVLNAHTQRGWRYAGWFESH